MAIDQISLPELEGGNRDGGYFGRKFLIIGSTGKSFWREGWHAQPLDNCSDLALVVQRGFVVGNLNHGSGSKHVYGVYGLMGET
ncbi:hypothetical protein CD944_06890 [Brevundimonas diminuta]|nr:hypothetical protein CD944_06890 [Brevundimonas diminuta]